MKVEYAKWGNSLAVRIPKTIADEIGAREGKSAELSVEDGALILRPIVRKRRGYRLDDLLKGMKPDQVHELAGWGPPRGTEVW